VLMWCGIVAQKGHTLMPDRSGQRFEL